jgi:hypothetical protein
VSVDTTGIRGARYSDGSLPTLTYLRLKTGSDLIDVGVNIGIAYNGPAPDLGAFEYGVVIIMNGTKVTMNNGKIVKK